MQHLIAFIAAHGQFAIEQDGQLMVLSHSARDGRSWFEWERCDATVRAVKLWLGY